LTGLSVRCFTAAVLHIDGKGAIVTAQGSTTTA